jgi:hypothetical protein
MEGAAIGSEKFHVAAFRTQPDAHVFAYVLGQVSRPLKAVTTSHQRTGNA